MIFLKYVVLLMVKDVDLNFNNNNKSPNGKQIFWHVLDMGAFFYRS